jgi:hypothetical protein
VKDLIFDPLRKKRVPLTPEEGVRQSFITYLNSALGYPFSLMASEYSVKFNGRIYRADIVAFTSNLAPEIVVECKAPSVKINGDTARQIIRYNMALKVNYLIITNGVATFVCKFDKVSGEYVFINEIPKYRNNEFSGE